ncbi:hypothetical protein EPA93_33245 [Ktedonosporobacter rubrisoli]|uniref:Uncharacterized protein n=1 Tax=Ktedonosporobacter rubrisoli TaxID=2509675 RepID=A0A4P6JXT1_KTERU|nr:hypothetical protein [Ktedonosporobacter rubrisoli]QBD80577.1 hypothetical protein EPA93_33245 [Ktedonosporobacter rubrisoli]
MNMLIIGGLAAVAILAVIGLVLVLMSEKNTPAAELPSSTAPALAAPGEPRTTTMPIQQTSYPSQSQPLTHPSQSLASNTLSHSLPASNGSISQPDYLSAVRLRGQLRELSSELRNLHQQAEEIEQRISVLTGMTTHLEQMIVEQSGREETSSVPLV